MATKSGWEMVETHGGLIDSPRVRRLQVEGGWLYQVQKENVEEQNSEQGHYVVRRVYWRGWHDPTFVPKRR